MVSGIAVHREQLFTMSMEISDGRAYADIQEEILQKSLENICGLVVRAFSFTLCCVFIQPSDLY